MNWKLHSLINFFALAPIVYFTLPPSAGWAYNYWYVYTAIIAAFSGHLPDFDIILMKIGPWVHRDVFWHSFIIPLISPVLYLFLAQEFFLYSIGLFCIGYGLHLLFDFFPKMKLSGFGLIHVWSDAKPEKWSLNWLTWGFLISAMIGVGILVFTWLF